MIRRPKPGEDEADILRMQEEYLRQKSSNSDLRPAAQVTNLRPSQSQSSTPPPANKRPVTDEGGARKPSKYAQSRGLKNHVEKRARFDESVNTVIGDIQEKNVQELEEKIEEDDDQVYFPKIKPALLGNIVEKNVDGYVDLDFSAMPSEGFPVATKRGDIKRTVVKTEAKISGVKMDIDESTASTSNCDTKSLNLPKKSYMLSSKEADSIHNDKVGILSKMTEQEILEEQQKILANLDPKLVEFVKARRKQADISKTVKEPEKMVTNEPETQKPVTTDDGLWENDVLSHPDVGKWLNFDSLEKDKLAWMKGIEDSKQMKPDEPYEARFDFKGYLLPYSMEYTEHTKTLFHHGDESHRPGYSLTELFELSRSTVTQQRIIAINTIAGILEYYSAGTYKNIIEIPLSKIFFVIRFAMDENKVAILEPSLKALRNLLYNRVDEACLDALIGFEEGLQQPCLENDKSEIQELDSKESELKDFHLAEIDIVTALMRTDILQRLYYILNTVKPTFNSVQYALQILTRLARDSVETATKIVEMEHLMKTVILNFVPKTSINFGFDPDIVYNGKPVLAAMKMLRVLSLQSQEIASSLINNYDILTPISEYISSGVDGTYGLRIQIEAYTIMSNLLHYNLGVDNALSVCPVAMTTLYKHVHGTDIFVSSSILSATHAAAVLQFTNKLLNCSRINLDSYKQQLYPLLQEGVQKWLAQLSQSEGYLCGHLRIICSALDCCKSVLLIENLQIKVLNNSLKALSSSRGFKDIVKQLIPCSNLLSELDNSHLHFTNNLVSLGGSVVDSAHKVLPSLSVVSPLPLLASLFKLLEVIEDKNVVKAFVDNITEYLDKITKTTPSLCENWFSRIEIDFLFSVVKVSIQSDIEESKKDKLYAVANKLCYVLRIDKKHELQYLFNNIVFNKEWFTAERLMNLISLTDTEGFSKALHSIDDIRLCYSKVANLNYQYSGPNVVLRLWKEPILPRDWIYLPILNLYSKSQEADTAPKVYGELADKVEAEKATEKERTISSSLEWILFNELCFPDLLNDIDITDRFCRIMCVFLCDNALFLDPKIKILLHKCIQNLFKKEKRSGFNFNRQLIGLHNFQDFYTQFLEQFQSVSYGDTNFAACVLVPLAQKHNVKWRKLLWSEYAGCLRPLDCPEELLCYDIEEYLYPEETDQSLIKSYFRALSCNLLRPNTIAFKIARHHAEAYKLKNKPK